MNKPATARTGRPSLTILSFRVLFCLLIHFPGPRCLARETPFRVGRFNQEIALHRERQGGLPSRNVLRIVADGQGRTVAETDRGFARWQGDQWQPCDPLPLRRTPSLPPDTEQTQLTSAPDGKKWALASQQGLFEKAGGEDWRRLKVADGLGRLWAESDVRGATYDTQGRLWFASLAGIGCRELNGQWRFWEGKDGLPYNDFTSAAAGPDGSVWFGTRRGAVRLQDGQWAYRQGLRWLPHDEVRGIHVDAENTVWFATPAGVGCLARRPLTLAEKAEFYEAEIDRYNKRTSYGYVDSSRLSGTG